MNTNENQVLQPVQNATELGMTLDVLTHRLTYEPYCMNLFASTSEGTAFPTPTSIEF